MRYISLTALVAIAACSFTTTVIAQSTSLDGYWSAGFGPEAGGEMGLNGHVRAIGIHPTTGDAYVGGDMSSAGDVRTVNIARWDGTQWYPLGDGTRGRVHALAFAADGTLYVGGSFSRVQQPDGTVLPATNIARWDGTSWSTVGLGVTGTVYSLEYDQASGNLYAGGSFDEAVNADSTAAGSSKIAYWDGTLWKPMGRGLADAPGTHRVTAIAVDPSSGHVAVGGRFLNVVVNTDGTEVDTDGLAFWDGASWSKPSLAPIRIDVLEYDAEGRLIVGGGFFSVGDLQAGGLARLDDDEWESVGGHVPTGGVSAIVSEAGGLFVGGSFNEVMQDDGIVVSARKVAYLDLNTSRWHPLDDGIRRLHSPGVTALAIGDDRLYVGGVIASAGGIPSEFFAVWNRGEREFPTTPVRFSVNTRVAERYNLVQDFWSPKPLVKVLTGELAGLYYTFDDDGDGIHSIEIDQPAGQVVEYVFLIDQSGDAIDNGDAIYELDAPAVTRRFFIATNGQSTDAPTALFDDRNLPGPDAHALEYNTAWLAQGGSRRLMTASHVHELELRLEESDRTVFVGVWQTDDDPSGAVPPEILQIANELLWTFETYPAAADYKMKVEWDYSEITGIADPNSLTLLHRSHPDSVWKIVPTEVVLNDEELHTPGVERLAGEWTVGSITSDNVLTNLLPTRPSGPQPGDGALNVPIRPVLRWAESAETSSYGVYLWGDGEAEPASPIAVVAAPVYESNPLEDDATYNWKVDARNINGAVVGPTWSFTIGDVPDLQVTSVEGPTETFSGQVIEVDWLVSNTGESGTNAPSWSDAIYVSSAAEFDLASATHLGDVRNLSSLNPGEEYASIGQVQLPRGIEGTYYVHVVADGGQSGRGDLDEGDETNNVGPSTPIAVTLEPYADLEVTDVIAGDIAFSGDSVDVSWTVTNAGTGQSDVDEWFDTIFLSEDDQFDFNFPPGLNRINISELRIGSLRHQGVLEADEAYTVTHRVKLPTGVFGDRFLFVASDTKGAGKQPEGGQVFEFNQELDNWTSEALSITLTPPADLQLASVVGPAEALSGQTVEVSWTVVNSGAGGTKSSEWHDDVFISTDATVDSTTSLLLGHFRHRGNLQVDESYQANDNVRIPDGWIGPSHFHVRTDVNDDEFEFIHEDNNSGSTGPAAEVALAPYPDLRIENVTLSSSTVRAGTQVALTYEIVNDGDGTAGGTWVDSVFTSPESAFDRSRSRVVGEVELEFDLAAGERKSVIAAITIPPAATGDQRVFVVPDARGDLYEYPDNPIGVGKSQVVEVDAYLPVDLAVELDGGPAAAGSGSTIKLSSTVRNSGSGRTLADSWLDRIYLSDDDELDPETDVLLFESDHEGVLDGGGSYVNQRSVMLPDGLTGAQFLILHSDAGGVVAEVNEDNNLAVRSVEMMLTPPSDLRVSQVGAPDETEAGVSTEITWSVENFGTGSTAGDHWFDALYLSGDSHRGGLDILLGTFERNGSLDAGDSYEASTQVVFPAWAAGPYHMLIVPDTRNDIYEHLAEGNNLGVHIVELGLPLPSDLAVSDVSAPSQALAGDSIEVSWTLTNIGANPARGNIREVVFISDDESWDITDPLLAVGERVIDLAPGAVGKASMTVDVGRIFEADSLGAVRNELPALLPGDYHLIVRSDVANVVRETDLGNNLAVGSSLLNVEIPPLALGVPEVMTVGSGQSRYFAVEVGADVDLRLTLSSDQPNSGNEVYVAFGRPPVAGGDFDGSAAEPFLSNQQLILPVHESGTHYALVHSRSLPRGVDSQKLTVLGEALIFSVRAIEPSQAGDRGETSFLVSGARFSPDSDVYLHRAGADTVRPNLIRYSSSTELLARIPTGGLELGTWDFFVENPSGEIASVEGGLIIEEADPPGLAVDLVAPDVGRVGVPTPFQILATNSTNVNVQRATIVVRYPRELEVLDVQVPESRMSQPWDPDEDVIKWDDGSSLLLFFLSDLRPGETSVLNLLVRASRPIDAGLAVNFTEFTRSGLFWRLFKGEHALIVSGQWDFPDTGDSSIGKLFEASENACDPCENLGEGERELCDYRARQAPTVDNSQRLAWRFFGGGPRSVGSPGGWRDLMCAPTGQDPCGDDGVGPPPDPPCFCDGGDCQIPHDPTWWNPFDPNEMVGPESFGEDNWVAAERALNYMIRFENDPELATAPAQLVQVRQGLDTDLDERTFRLGPFGFGKMTFSPPENVAHFNTRIDLADSLGFLLDVAAGLDVVTNEIFWSLKTIDPSTGDQPITDPRAGFLPVNDSTDAGQGFVSYRIASDANSVTRDTVHAVASIIFDTNPPIDTPAIFNTIDADPPVSSVNVLAARQDSAVFNLSWTAQDVGSGIRDYSLYRSVDGGSFEVIEANVIDTTRLFVGEIGSQYRFFTIARDNAGNVEPLKNQPEAFTTVSTTEDNPAGIPKEFALHQSYPNPFNPSTTIPFDLPESGKVEIAVYDIMGRLVLTVERGDLVPGHYQHLLRMDQYASGVYLYQLRVTGQTSVKFVDVGKFVLIK